MAAVAPDGSQFRVDVDLRSLPSEILRSLHHCVQKCESLVDGRTGRGYTRRQVVLEGIGDDLPARSAGERASPVDP